MKTQSNHALCAKSIRNELKKEFPETIFSVKSRVYSGGSSVDVQWTNGATYDTVNKILSKYQYGNFDGMTDCYNYTNTREDIPQVKYVHLSREVSEDIKQSLFEECRKRYDGWQHLTSLDHCCSELMKKWCHWTPREYIQRLTSKMDLTYIDMEELLSSI